MAIKDAIDSGQLSARISFVGSDRHDSPGLGWAMRQGMRCLTLDYSKGRDAAERQIELAMKDTGTHHLVLAGFMRILSEGFTRRHKGRVINIHPSLLPSFPGRNGIADAFSYGVMITGVTVHLVDEQVDHGPILAQEAIPVTQSDTMETLEEKIHRVEHRIYPAIIDRWLREGDFSLLKTREVAHDFPVNNY